jgi:hypothetical protein
MSQATISKPTEPCEITTPEGTTLWLPDTGLGRAIRERLEKKGWEWEPPRPKIISF